MKNRKEIEQLATKYAKAMYPNDDVNGVLINEAFVSFIAGYCHSDHFVIKVNDTEKIAKLFHDTYEKLAPSFGYETRKETNVDWDNIPENNKQLMIAVVKSVLEHLN